MHCSMIFSRRLNDIRHWNQKSCQQFALGMKTNTEQFIYYCCFKSTFMLLLCKEDSAKHVEGFKCWNCNLRFKDLQKALFYSSESRTCHVKWRSPSIQHLPLKMSLLVVCASVSYSLTNPSSFATASTCSKFGAGKKLKCIILWS